MSTYTPCLPPVWTHASRCIYTGCTVSMINLHRRLSMYASRTLYSWRDNRTSTSLRHAYPLIDLASCKRRDELEISFQPLAVHTKEKDQIRETTRRTGKGERASKEISRCCPPPYEPWRGEEEEEILLLWRQGYIKESVTRDILKKDRGACVLIGVRTCSPVQTRFLLTLCSSRDPKTNKMQTFISSAFSFSPFVADFSFQFNFKITRTLGKKTWDKHMGRSSLFPHKFSEYKPTLPFSSTSLRTIPLRSIERERDLS